VSKYYCSKLAGKRASKFAGVSPRALSVLKLYSLTQAHSFLNSYSTDASTSAHRAAAERSASSQPEPEPEPEPEPNPNPNRTTARRSASSRMSLARLTSTRG